ncbi:hypothetical protein BC332_18424 [Capsicum chinense]|nr:hypothetical protein BC332_18424 [Capsicum chinense]
MGEMTEDGIKTSHIMSFATLKAQAIQKGLGNVGGKNNEEDATAIVVGQWERSRRPHQRRSQAQAQAPHKHSQNLLYSVPPPPYLVYHAQPYVQPPPYPQ